MKDSKVYTINIQLFKGKYRIIQQLPTKRKYKTYIVQKLGTIEQGQQRGKKYIAKIQQISDKKKLSNGQYQYIKKSRHTLPLQQEIQILLDIQRNIDKVGFPKAYDVFQTKNKRILITDLRSIKLERLIPLLLENFTQIQYTKFCLKMIYDLFDRIQSIHRAKYIHKNIRPEIINFKKTKNNKDVLFINDYSNSQKFNEYNIKKQNYHNSYKYGVKPQGNTGFASIWTHTQISKSRRDDIESLCYIAIYMLRQGQLPWADIQFGTNQKQENKIFEKKLKLINSDIFESQKQQQESTFQAFMNFVEGFSSKNSLSNKKDKQLNKVPKQIRQIIIETRNLEYQQQPNYNFIRKSLKKAMNRFQITETQDYIIPLDMKLLYPKGY